MDMTLVERIARAITSKYYTDFRHYVSDDFPDREAFIEHHWPECAQLARDILATISTPTEAMLAAPTAVALPRSVRTDLWRTMALAAIEEGLDNGV